MKRISAAVCTLSLLASCASQPPQAEAPPVEVKAEVKTQVKPQVQPQVEPALAAPSTPPMPPAPLPAVMPLAEVAPVPVAPLPKGHPIAPRAPVKRIEAEHSGPDLWQRIREGFAMPELDNAYVRRHTGYYTRRPDYLQRMFDRSRPYLYHIVEEIERRKLPTELALLPMVESAFNPMAHSPARASGLWQFIPGTGRRFGLEQDWWYDERRDVVDSTSAALDYLTELHHMYRDWHLALASYNWGENAVARAIAKNRRARKPTGYWHLRMPRETRNYVPKLQALKNIIRSPERYGVELKPIPNVRYFVTLADTPAMDLHLAARLAEMPVEEFIALNPGFNRPFIRAAGKRKLILPADKVYAFYANLAEHEPKPLVSWTAYRPVRGDTFAKLARRFGLTVSELKKVNGVRPWSSRLPQTMIVPVRIEAREALKLPVIYGPPARVIVHRVRRGDTLSGIARRYGVSVEALKRWNRTGRHLRIGQKIYVRKGVATS
jgi:membrane-bound lytic murein transglycosylase D